MHICDRGVRERAEQRLPEVAHGQQPSKPSERVRQPLGDVTNQTPISNPEMTYLELRRSEKQELEAVKKQMREQKGLKEKLGQFPSSLNDGAWEAYDRGAIDTVERQRILRINHAANVAKHQDR
mmetsp:Transcript_63686/g.143309  ORF Transcript_63686/g.143309 Transcript_63686/m.143309 type:complete len:124 (+) Transcript_63686:146-517(+)